MLPAELCYEEANYCIFIDGPRRKLCAISAVNHVAILVIPPGK